MAQRKSNRKTSFGKKTEAEKSFERDRSKKRPRLDSTVKRPFARPGIAARQRFDREGNPGKRGGVDRTYSSGASGRSVRNGEGESARPFKKRNRFDSSTEGKKFSDSAHTGKPFGKRTGFDSSFEKKPWAKRSDFIKRPSGKTTPTTATSQDDYRDSKPPTRPYGKKDQLETDRGKDRISRGSNFAGRRAGKETSGFRSKTGSGDRSSSGKSWAKPGKPYSGFTRKVPLRKHSSNTSIHKTAKREDGLTRLNKYIANSGMGSRREADEMIKMGLISVNGTVITAMGFKVKEGDVVKHEDKVLKAEKPVYVLLNKPKGFITTTADPQERKTVMNLVASACKERIYPVGRLDRNTTGLLLLTNDGDLADKLTHPSYKAKKIYKAELDRPLTKNDFQKIVDGVHLEEGKALVDDLAYVDEGKKEIGIELHIGWNRVVRRIFESLDYEVVKLDRVVYAGLDKKDLPRGEWRFLKPEEIVTLKHFK